MIQVYECFTVNGAHVKGELWEEMHWDFAAPSVRTFDMASWKLSCDFRLPCTGVFRFMHPNNDDAVEFKFVTPSLTLPDHSVGVIKPKSFTPALKRDWEELPDTITFQIGKMTLTCKKDIVDAVECSILGELYLYRPLEIRIN